MWVFLHYLLITNLTRSLYFIFLFSTLVRHDPLICFEILWDDELLRCLWNESFLLLSHYLVEFTTRASEDNFDQIVHIINSDYIKIELIHQVFMNFLWFYILDGGWQSLTTWILLYRYFWTSWFWKEHTGSSITLLNPKRSL